MLLLPNEATTAKKTSTCTDRCHPTYHSRQQTGRNVDSFVKIQPGRFTGTIWAYFVHFFFFQHTATRIKTNFKKFNTFFFFPPQFGICLVFGGKCVSLATPCCHTFGFCIAPCVVSALNCRAIRSEACIFAAKYQHSPFFWKSCWNCFEIIFTGTKWNEKERKIFIFTGTKWNEKEMKIDTLT